MAFAMERHLEEVIMQSSSQAVPASAARLWTGRILSGLTLAFMLFDSVIKFFDIAPVREAMQQLGYPAGAAFTIGLIELACVVLYAVPRTSVLGAVLLTAHLGGGIASHLRIGSPLASHTLFPIYVAALMWGGLYLREDRLRALLPFRR